MASEYLNWKYRDVQPDKPLVLTKEQRRKNWWNYHKWQVIIGAVLFITTLSILRYTLGIGITKPDYQIGYVGSAPLPEDTVAALENRLSEYGQDVNHDGKVVVKIKQYPTDASEEGADAAAYAAASSMRLMGDLESRENCFFILDDVETFHLKYEVLADKDGNIAADRKDVESYQWSSCPVLSAMDLGNYTEKVLGKNVTGSSDELLSTLYFARYGKNPDEKPTSAGEACEAFWKALTKGAKQ